MKELKYVILTVTNKLIARSSTHPIKVNGTETIKSTRIINEIISKITRTFSKKSFIRNFHSLLESNQDRDVSKHERPDHDHQKRP